MSSRIFRSVLAVTISQLLIALIIAGAPQCLKGCYNPGSSGPSPQPQRSICACDMPTQLRLKTQGNQLSHVPPEGENVRQCI